MATTHEVKPKGAALIDGIKSSSWQSRLAAAIVAALVVLLLIQAVKDPGQFVSQLLIGITNGAIIALIALGYMLVYGLINVGIERVAYKPLRNSPRLAVLITAIGMSFILQNVGLVWKGSFQ